MIDNVNPNSQFHPYQPMNDLPASERQQGGLRGMLGSILKNGQLGSTLNGSLGSLRDYAKAKPGVVLGGLAALAIGAGLMRKRMS